jgi:hypothetical protein
MLSLTFQRQAEHNTYKISFRASLHTSGSRLQLTSDHITKQNKMYRRSVQLSLLAVLLVCVFTGEARASERCAAARALPHSYVTSIWYEHMKQLQ